MSYTGAIGIKVLSWSAGRAGRPLSACWFRRVHRWSARRVEDTPGSPRRLVLAIASRDAVDVSVRGSGRDGEVVGWNGRSYD